MHFILLLIFFILRLDFTHVFSSRMVGDQDEVVYELDDDLAGPLMDYTFLMDPCQVGTVRGVSLVQTLYQNRHKISKNYINIIKSSNLLCGGVNVNADTEGNDNGDCDG